MLYNLYTDHKSKAEHEIPICGWENSSFVVYLKSSLFSCIEVDIRVGNMHLSERATRKQRIDAALLESGWDLMLPAGAARQRGLVALEECQFCTCPALQKTMMPTKVLVVYDATSH